MSEAQQQKIAKKVLIAGAFVALLAVAYSVYSKYAIKQTKISECKEQGFLGYVPSKMDVFSADHKLADNIYCSNGEKQEGCFKTKDGVICGDNIQYVKIK